ncbi:MULTISPECIES: haloacid dehalogenase type II [unclassified Pantoea]|uniref:haloacid dehalogenase type II n=1 Tax=unclassified Pantoea TaxID=2630326 RepID=UPI001CD4D935|nr:MULTISPECIES: haloacid dehalogenase type II [unclassified Pantoea]MCA1179486.1 haloacid dehalogenase type II [Pantoea sp. alder69]MCA1251739.1 haloacid dehalogenase type II [Pantoea sp. alder70]MCA1267924.1 haloacid dehalogenase type II [Pantoea sp. alder81]
MTVNAKDIEFLGFDVFGTVVDWRTGVARASEPFLRKYHLDVDPFLFADEWRSLYQPAMEEVRTGRRGWVKLGVLNRENLEAVLAKHNAELSAIPPAELDTLNAAWEKLDPWPDTVEGLNRLKKRFFLGTLSNSHIAGMVTLARFAHLPWDAILGAELARNYKPRPETYLVSADAAGVKPSQFALVAAHNDDLLAAKEAGLKTIFVFRRTEHGPSQSIDLSAEHDWDYVAEDMIDLANILNCP